MALTEIPIELSSSPGIVDNSNATAITIDASENVGIGTSTPNQLLTVADSSGGATVNISTDQAPGSISAKKYMNLDFSGFADTVMARIQSWDESSSTGNGYLTFHTTPSGGSVTERMRIDGATGSLLLGQTSESSTDTGHIFNPIGVAFHIRDGGVPLVAVRKTDDGELVQFKKDTAVVGSIGSEGGDSVYIQGGTTGGAGLHFKNNTGDIRPLRNGATIDATINLGSDTRRFKDLYLSGGVQNITASGVATGTLISAITGVTNGFQISANTSNEMTYDFNTGAGLKMRFTNDGNLLVGTTSTINSGLGVFSKANSNQLVINSSNSNGGSLDFCNGGASASARIGGLTTGTATALQVQVGATGGVQLASGATSWTSMSDERLKDIIEPISDAVSKLLTLRTVIGKYKVDAPQVRRVFVIAQDVEKVLPEAVSKSTVSLDDPEEFLGVAYSELIPLLIAGFKEQQATIEALTARIAALES
jgi:hypothetical protein